MAVTGRRELRMLTSKTNVLTDSGSGTSSRPLQAIYTQRSQIKHKLELKATFDTCQKQDPPATRLLAPSTESNDRCIAAGNSISASGHHVHLHVLHTILCPFTWRVIPSCVCKVNNHTNLQMKSL